MANTSATTGANSGTTGATAGMTTGSTTAALTLTCDGARLAAAAARRPPCRARAYAR
ncbi:exported hypothetical protein [Nostocoides jenkinsii Ben 74]|uniref:Uncharacterized protein n=1 Tax=Nostocoides jenkinsii Ben 74 TaxID=1193518 RepID=A0A077MCY6_9MICO|nr:exported hypothetical protein [Tetrasphaera jenkinsii Ben 74]